MRRAKPFGGQGVGTDSATEKHKDNGVGREGSNMFEFVDFSPFFLEKY
jgi:hypothetical protein